jgi:hypothetical protein
MRLQPAADYVRADDVGTRSDARWNVRPLLIVNPRSDIRFRQRAAELTADAEMEPSDLQANLRAEFPDAIVRRRELSSESTEVWYVYRDGRWTPD